MSSHVNAVILAAGQGKRMHSSLPKVLHPLAGRPLLAHVIETARALEPANICIVYGHGGDQVPRAVAGDNLTFALQQPQLGTGHALKQALPHIDARGTTLVLYGDVPLVSADTLRGMLIASGERLVLLTAEVDDPRGYGRVVRDSKGSITAIVEEKDATAAQRRIREINTGIMALPSRRLAGWLARLANRNAQREYYLTDVVKLAFKDRVTIESRLPHARWEVLGVNSMDQLAQIERIAQRQAAQRLLDAGVTLADPSRLDVRGTLHCARDVRIDVNCVFEGNVEIAAHVQIGANCVLRNVSIGAGTRIEPFSMLDDAVIGADCRIGPFARIRPGTTLAEDVHIGNFVEVKASSIAARSKANHLAYVGDASVGRDVNIGAGTITCNYDGANKHRTVIEDDVFIGSDTALVAPVTVTKGSTIGAGSIITNDTPPGQLTLSRARQVSIAGWTRPKKRGRSKE